jgi:enoyl-CoA hydratase
MFTPTTAKDAGFLDSVVAPESLMPSAQAMAQQFKKLNLKAHAGTKLKARKALLATLDAAIELDKTAGFA